jgi:hypothetical protein
MTNCYDKDLIIKSYEKGRKLYLIKLAPEEYQQLVHRFQCMSQTKSLNLDKEGLVIQT